MVYNFLLAFIHSGIIALTAYLLTSFSRLMWQQLLNTTEELLGYGTTILKKKRLLFNAKKITPSFEGAHHRKMILPQTKAACLYPSQLMYCTSIHHMLLFFLLVRGYLKFGPIVYLLWQVLRFQPSSSVVIYSMPTKWTLHYKYSTWNLC